jgi:hypothetical protein
MSNAEQFIKDHRTVLQTTGGTLASIALEKSGEKLAGNLVTPAIWVYNYVDSGATPDGADASIYATGLAGGVAAPAAIATSMLKSVVDDDTARKVSAVRKGELPRYRPFIMPCSIYAPAPSVINAQTIASKGGTAWQHPNGIWVYITDARGRLVSDFKPKAAVKIYQPVTPLTKTTNNRYRWQLIK